MSHSLPQAPVPAQLEFLNRLLPLTDSDLESREDTVPLAAAIAQRLQSQPLAAPTATKPSPRRLPRAKAKQQTAQDTPHNASASRAGQLPLFESAVDSNEPLLAAPDSA